MANRLLANRCQKIYGAQTKNDFLHVLLYIFVILQAPYRSDEKNNGAAFDGIFVELIRVGDQA